ncbi:hypothetical protein F5Y08DRAFT_344484 [Xylaria arbuscula]|nr:hypothetical protein F5Y08DRAFT_344484 [Xylaria arbuscula]
MSGIAQMLWFDSSRPRSSVTYGQDTDGGSSTAVPSLANSGSTANSFPVDFPPTRKPLLSLEPTASNVPDCQHSFKVVRARESLESNGCPTCNQTESEQSFFECSHCKTQKCHSCYDKHHLCEFDFDDVFLPPSPKLRPLLTEQNLNRLSIEDPEADAFEDRKIFLPSCLVHVREKRVFIETSNAFFVNIHLPLNLGNVAAAEIEGERCYISEELVQSYIVSPESSVEDCGIFIWWRDSKNSAFTRTWCEILEKSRIRGECSLILGKDRKHELTIYDVLDDPCVMITTRILWNESSPTTQALVEAHKKEAIDKIVVDTTVGLGLHFEHTRKGIKEATAGSYGSDNTSSVTSSQPSDHQAQPSKKRRLGDRDDDGFENDDSDELSPPEDGEIKGNKKETLRFACPYLKYNPSKYQRCRGPGWLDVHRVKEHLYRKHRQPKFKCMRCCEHFDSEQPYVNHQRAPVPCQLRDPEPIEGFNADQEKQLKSRKKKDHIVTEADKWRAVFHILFPDVKTKEIPSPFYEHEQSSGPTAPSHEAIATEIEEYILREFPPRLHQKLAAEFDRDLQVGERRVKSGFVEITKVIIAELFQEYRQQAFQQRAASTMAQGPNSPENHVDPSVAPVQPLWINSMDFLDQMNLACNLSLDAAGMAIWENNCTQKFSDSGYVSNVSEQLGDQPNRQ